MADSVKRAFDIGANTYDRARRRLIPCFDEFYRAAVEQIPFAAETEFEVLDLGAGTGMLAAFIAFSYPRARITLVDMSNEMLARARERFGPGGDRFRFIERDFADMPFDREYGAIVSALSIHHLPDETKRALFRRAHAALHTGGVFINADQVYGESDDIERRNQATWLKRVRELGPSAQDLSQALERMTFDRTIPTEVQLGWLRDSGFSDVALVYRNLIFAVYSGRK
ncbi:MAG: class I SAM-dependent methyltransferase [Candidatus Binataceae bacterium]